MLIYPINSYPAIVNSLLEAMVSGRRLSKFLLEAPDKCTHPELLGESLGPSSSAYDINAVVNIRNETFSWGRPSNTENSRQPFKLEKITLKVTRGQLAVICGPVAAGKS